MIVLAKLVGSLLYPLNLALLALLVALLVRRWKPRSSRWLAVSALAWIWLWSTPWIAERSAWTLERDFPPVVPTSLPDAEAIVLLGGLLQPAHPPFAPDPDLNGAADRAWFAARLWRAGKAPRLICTGGVAPLSRTEAPECPDIVRLLVDFGVPENAIDVEDASRTTRENAIRTARLLPADSRILLVTSARHLPRALPVFDKAGLTALPAATDHAWRPDRPFALSAVLPSASALALSTSIWHEWLGRIWYAASDD